MKGALDFMPEAYSYAHAFVTAAAASLVRAAPAARRKGGSAGMPCSRHMEASSRAARETVAC